MSGLAECIAAQYDEQSERDDLAAEKKISLRFRRCVQYQRAIIVPLLSELQLIMGQLCDSEGKYAKFIDITKSGPITADASILNDTEAVSGLSVDIADISVRLLAQQLTSEIVSLPQAIVPRSPGRNVDNRTRKTKNVFTQILDRFNKSTKVVTEPKRLLWTFVDRKRCHAKLLRVQQLNDALQESLGHGQMELLIESTNQFKLMLTQVQSGVEDVKVATGNLQALVAASHNESRPQLAEDDATTWSGPTLVNGESSSAGPTRNSGREGDFMGRAAGFMLEVMDRSSSDLPKTLMDDEIVRNIEYKVSLDDDLRMTAVLPDGKPVWIEWKMYETLSTGYRAPIRPETLARTERLVSLLQIQKKPREFCVPPCLGYFVEASTQRLGVVYSAPARARSSTPRSLLSCFEMEHVPLSNKVNIAQRLSQWLLHLHAVRWLHKGIRSANILFFVERGKDFGNPYITGFDYARSAAATQTTTKPPENSPWLLYVHPDYLGSKQGLGYKKIYDIYSLGIVLIELACWSSIAQIVDISRVTESDSISNGDQAVAGAHVNEDLEVAAPLPKASDLTADDIDAVRKRILSGRLNVLERVRSSAGDKYHDVVKACLSGMRAFGLSGSARETDNNASAELLEAFHRIVIEPLRSISV